MLDLYEEIDDVTLSSLELAWRQTVTSYTQRRRRRRSLMPVGMIPIVEHDGYCSPDEAVSIASSCSVEVIDSHGDDVGVGCNIDICSSDEDIEVDMISSQKDNDVTCDDNETQGFDIDVERAYEDLLVEEFAGLDPRPEYELRY